MSGLNVGTVLGVLVIAFLWADSYRASGTVVYAAAGDGDVRRTVALSSCRGLLSFTRAATNAQPDCGDGGQLRYSRQATALPDPMLGAGGTWGFACIDRPRVTGAPIESAWTYAAMPWWAMAVVGVVPLTLKRVVQIGRRSLVGGEVAGVA